MAFDVKMLSELSRSSTSSSGRLKATMSSSAPISLFGAYAGPVAEAAVGLADEDEDDIRKNQVSHARFGSAWRCYPCAMVGKRCPCRDSLSDTQEMRSRVTEDQSLVPVPEAEVCSWRAYVELCHVRLTMMACRAVSGLEPPAAGRRAYKSLLS